MDRTRSRLAAGLASLTLAGAGLAGGGVVAASPAEAVTVTATVHNFFYCSNQTGKCRQTNGPYKSWIPTTCQWTFATYWTGTSTGVCDYWRR